MEFFSRNTDEKASKSNDRDEWRNIWLSAGEEGEEKSRFIFHFGSG